jgi:hypothetical protein
VSTSEEQPSLDEALALARAAAKKMAAAQSVVSAGADAD